MRKFSLWSKEKDYIRLAVLNSKAVHEYNEKMLFAISLAGGLLMILPVLATPFSNTKQEALPLYLIMAVFYLATYFLFKLSFMNKFVLVGLYLCFSVIFVMAIYLSVIHSPDMRATILLGAFCLIPFGFIDHPTRIILFVFFWFAVHTILAFYLKPQYAMDDTINCLCFAIFGSFVGKKTIRQRLDCFEAGRLLTIEKETDVLTGLLNRRKLFETLAVLETADSEKPSGILMIDIDRFKQYNDAHGHAEGDRCLHRLGEVFNLFSKNFRLNFYRYGGEEFVAIAYGYSEKELFSIADNLRVAVEETDMDGHNITISIGLAYCGNNNILNYEKVIDRADMAVYSAKSGGRNRVCVDPD